jgi:hypothetical protein
MDDPFNLKEANGFFSSDNCNCIVGDDKGATICSILGQFLILRKGPRENSLHLISQRNW